MNSLKCRKILVLRYFHFLSLYDPSNQSHTAESCLFRRKKALEKKRDRISRNQKFPTFLNMIRSRCEILRVRAGLSFSLSTHKNSRTFETSTLSKLLDGDHDFIVNLMTSGRKRVDKLINNDRPEHFGSIWSSYCK